jgi:starch synthase
MIPGALKVLFAASEVYPLASTGGLASVVAELPGALIGEGLDVRVIIPYYGDLSGRKGIRWVGSGKTYLGEDFGIARTKLLNGVWVYLVARDEDFSRKGFYGPTPDTAWPDNCRRFAFFSRAVEASPAITGFKPDVFHCHDWQTGLLPVYLHRAGIPSVFTIHNLAFQGRFGPESWPASGLPDEFFRPDRLEFWGDWNMMKGGILFAGAVTTVSPSYAREIRTPRFGFGLESVLEHEKRKLHGILNGIDHDCWNPETDSVIPATFGPGSMAGRKRCRRELAREMGLPEGGGPLVGMVTRLTAQKGVDLVLEALPGLVGRGMRLAVLGTGEAEWERAFRAAAARYPDTVSVRIEYCDSLARRIFAGSDVFLMPSMFEPCGISQMIAMRYGSVPLVRRTGGLGDTVSGETGFLFEASGDFPRALDAVSELWQSGPSRWTRKRKLCMKTDNSWKNRTAGYLKLYRRAKESMLP